MAAKKIEHEVETENEVKEIKKPVVKETKKFSKGDYIHCHSISAGTVIMIGIKTGEKYMWIGENADVEVAYEDLIDEVRKYNKNGVLYTPLIIVDDEDFVNQNKQLKDLYDNMYTTQDLSEILNLPVNQMKEVIAQLPSGVTELLKNMISSKIENGSLDSVSKIKALDEIFETKFMLLTEMFTA